MSFLPVYAELHCLSGFSFLRGASHGEEPVAGAAQLGYRAPPEFAAPHPANLPEQVPAEKCI